MWSIMKNIVLFDMDGTLTPPRESMDTLLLGPLKVLARYADIGVVTGSDFNYVVHLAGRDPNYVRNKMLNKVIQREANILAERDRIKRGVDNIIILKQKLNPVPPKATYRKKKKRTWTKKQDFKWLPKYQPTYVDR